MAELSDQELRRQGWMTREAWQRYQDQPRWRRWLTAEEDFHGWCIYIAKLDIYDQQFDPPNRVHIHTPWGFVMIGLDRSGWSQAWLPWKVKNTWAESGKSHYSRMWWPITWNPRRRASKP